LILTKAYTKFIPSNDNKNHLISHLDFFALAIFFIVSVIKTSLALSLGLVGALSIIRFRTAIKEPGQIILLLVVTAIALSAAAEKEILALLLSIIYYSKAYLGIKKSTNPRKLGDRILRFTIKRSNLGETEIHGEKYFSRLIMSNDFASVEFAAVPQKELDLLLSKYSGLIDEYEII
ncbi:DUF4956 domain-containing protein, partial [Schleiferiaceae bacterium]|nr:DUF4956 domain-containing protein [Schleiferiaceae bacterium]